MLDCTYAYSLKPSSFSAAFIDSSSIQRPAAAAMGKSQVASRVHRQRPVSNKTKKKKMQRPASYKTKKGKMQRPESNKTKKGKIKVAIYARTSSKTNKKGNSFSRQFHNSMASMAKAGLNPKKMSITKVHECISGMLPLKSRKVLQNILDGGYDEVFVESLRSLTRSSTVAEAIAQKVQDSKIKMQIHVADMPGLFAKDATPQQRFQRRIAAAVNEYERDVIVQRLLDGLLARKARLSKKGIHKYNGRKSVLDHHPVNAAKKKKLKDLCKNRSKGKFGWRTLAKKASIILQVKPDMSHEAARTLSKQLL